MKKTNKPTPSNRAIQNERKAFRTGLARLVESEMERAEVVLSFKSIVDDFQSIAERLVRIEAEDLMPNLDALRAAYGPSVADRFYSSVTEKLRSTIETVQSTRSAISTEVLKLENVINGGAPNDMAMDDGSDDLDLDLGDSDLGGDMGDDTAPDAATAPVEPEATPMPGKGEKPTDEPEIDLGDDDPVFGGNNEAPAAGRARKESAQPRGRKLAETKRRGRVVESSKNLDPAILKVFRKGIAEGHAPMRVARVVAEKFRVELADVIEIVKEAKAAKNKKCCDPKDKCDSKDKKVKCDDKPVTESRRNKTGKR